MKYTVIVRKNETGEESILEGDEIACVAMHKDPEDPEGRDAGDAIFKTKLNNLASFLANTDFCKQLMLRMHLYTLLVESERKMVDEEIEL